MWWLVLVVRDSVGVHQWDGRSCVDHITLQSCLRGCLASIVMSQVLHTSSQLGHIVYLRGGSMLSLSSSSTVVVLITVYRIDIAIVWVNARQLVAQRDHLLMLGTLATSLGDRPSCVHIHWLWIQLLLLSIIEMIWEASLLLLSLLLLTKCALRKVLCIVHVLIYLICVNHVGILTLLRTIYLRIGLIVLNLLHLIVLILSVLKLVLLVHSLVCIHLALILMMYRFRSDGTARVLPVCTQALVLIWWYIHATMTLSSGPLVLVNDCIWLALVGSLCPTWRRCTHSIRGNSLAVSVSTWNLLTTATLPHWRVRKAMDILDLLGDKTHWVGSTAPKVCRTLLEVELLHPFKLRHAVFVHQIGLPFVGVLATSLSTLTSLWIRSLLDLPRLLCIHWIFEVFRIAMQVDIHVFLGIISYLILKLAIVLVLFFCRAHFQRVVSGFLTLWIWDLRWISFDSYGVGSQYFGWFLTGFILLCAFFVEFSRILGTAWVGGTANVVNWVVRVVAVVIYKIVIRDILPIMRCLAWVGQLFFQIWLLLLYHLVEYVICIIYNIDWSKFNEVIQFRNLFIESQK